MNICTKIIIKNNYYDGDFFFRRFLSSMGREFLLLFGGRLEPGLRVPGIHFVLWIEVSLHCLCLNLRRKFCHSSAEHLAPKNHLQNEKRKIWLISCNMRPLVMNFNVPKHTSARVLSYFSYKVVKNFSFSAS